MAQAITLSVPMEWAEAVASLFEDKAKHSELVAIHQTRIANERGAEIATARAEALRGIASPLRELVAAQEEAEARQRSEKAEAAKAARVAAQGAKAALKAAKAASKVKEAQEKAKRAPGPVSGSFERQFTARKRSKAEKLEIASQQSIA